MSQERIEMMERSLDSIKDLIEKHIVTHEVDIRNINEKLDVIYPVVKKDMESAEFWMKFQEKFKMGGSTVLWLVGVIAAVVILMGYGKVALLAWLGIKGQ